ncbi:hypothetical protein M422DRAFT_64637 [Sphaerobolus stellatus SS14]|nr:hypothetical protein M422DRAFT_64637 [Sphaerobolus stellatus SS14]
MPVPNLPTLVPYEQPPPTTADLDWADLPIIDVSQAVTEEGRLKLGEQVQDALINVGFFYVVNHGYTEEETAKMFSIANIPFNQVSPEEKKVYEGTPKTTGSYQGYKLRSYWHIDNGVRDQVENYNINHDTTKRNHPEALRPYLSDVASFARFNHEQILHPILKLLARGLELPEDTFVDHHTFEGQNESYVRFMKYYPRSREDEEKSQNVWLKGHTDFGSITILWSQPVSALQILSPDGKWRWIKHIDNALVINAGDCLEFLSGGFYKATIHRVVQPPPDQQHHDRLGAFYFAIPNDNVKLRALLESPVLQRVGVNDKFQTHNVEVATVEDWRKARTAAYGQSKLTSGSQAGVEEEVINGVVVKHYR